MKNILEAAAVGFFFFLGIVALGCSLASEELIALCDGHGGPTYAVGNIRTEGVVDCVDGTRFDSVAGNVTEHPPKRK